MLVYVRRVRLIIFETNVTLKRTTFSRKYWYYIDKQTFQFSSPVIVEKRSILDLLVAESRIDENRNPKRISQWTFLKKYATETHFDMWFLSVEIPA